MGRLLGIAVRGASRAPMETQDKVHISQQDGLQGDYRGKYGPRQITVLSQEAWQAACQDVQTDLLWTTRRANLLISGIELERTTRQILQIGPVRLAITGETDPCERMDMQHMGLRQALVPAWRGGVTCFVMTPGEIQLGDEVQLLSSTDSSA
jgi:MOSC domain-containing protein YiiM